jgi:hypothetical protein
MITSIKRLYEADDIQQMPMNGADQMQPQMQDMAPPAPVQSPAQLMPDFGFDDETPGEMDQEAKGLPQPDVMNLTVQELLDRCDKINPLICMGLKQFIDSNQEELINQTTGEEDHEDKTSKKDDITMDDTDLNFSKQMEPQSPAFSLDQPSDELNFPEE